MCITVSTYIGRWPKTISDKQKRFKKVGCAKSTFLCHPLSSWINAYKSSNCFVRIFFAVSFNPLSSLPGWPDWANYRLLSDYLLWTFFLITIVVWMFGLLFFHGKSCVIVLTKMSWAIFWAIFSQTHLVTLEPACLPAFHLKSCWLCQQKPRAAYSSTILVCISRNWQN
jgi:hypothetical protein